MSRYKKWSEIEKRCVAMTRDVFETQNRTWVTYVCYRRPKHGTYLQAFAILMMVPPDRNPTTDLWRTFRKATRTLRTFEIPSWIKHTEHFSVNGGPRPFFPQKRIERIEDLSPLDPAYLDAAANNCEQFAEIDPTPAPIRYTDDSDLQPWDDLDSNGRQVF